MRVLGSAVLVLEAIVLALAIPVAIVVGGVPRTTALAGGAVLVLLCLLATARVTSPIGLVLGSLVQVGAIASGVVVPGMPILGLVFAGLWVAAVTLGRRVDRFRALAAGDAAGPQEPRQ